MQSFKNVTGVRHLIAIASGKGGVGKSTIAVNLALTLLSLGRRTGLLDADIYGPSLPVMLGAQVKPDLTDEKKMQPVMLHGLQAMSIGWLVNETAPVIWRGPMATAALQQLLYDTLWEGLDELIIDLPPGTGDIHLTLAQKIPVTAAVIVTTPQKMALSDARRAIEMFRRVKIPVLGIIENMATYHCTHCGHQDAVFGKGGGVQIAREYDIPLLGSLPLQASVCMDTDEGRPTMARDSEQPVSVIYRSIAEQMLQYLKNPVTEVFPEIIVRND